MIQSQADLSDRLARLPHRSIIAIAGPPGSGKSTLAEELAAGSDDAAVLPMDGFHFDDAILRGRGRLPWKGAPDTFDVGGLTATLKRLLADEDDVAVPIFDRDLEVSRGSARIIPAATRLIIVEGNYLLLRTAPWSALAPFFALTVMIEVAEDELRRRLTARWQHYGLDDAAIRHKLDGNDLPNGQTVREESLPADIVLRQT